MVIKEEILSHPRVSPFCSMVLFHLFFENPSPGDRKTKKNNIWDLGFGLSLPGLLILIFFFGFSNGLVGSFFFFLRDFIPKTTHQFDGWVRVQPGWGITT